MVHFELFKVFLKIGATGYGGGSALAPLIHHETVEVKEWLTEDEFIDIVAIANMLPGPSMVEMATAIGYKMAGIMGALITSLAITLPIMIVFTVFMAALNRFIPIEILNAITAPVLGTVSALMLTLTKKFYLQSAKQISIPLILLISLTSLVLIYFLGIHPSLIIITMLIIIFLVSLKGGDE